MKHTIKRVPLNGARLRAARLNLGLGTRELARQAGTTFTLVDSIEKEDFIGSMTTLAELRAIAHAAGLSLTDLLDEQHADTHDTANADDVQRLAAILIADPRMQTNDDISRALDWTLPRFNDAANALNTAVAPLGLRVHRNPGTICLRPTKTTALEDAKRVDARRTGREGMNASEAALLYKALNGTLSDKLPKTAHPPLGHLINLGYLRPGARKEPLHVPTEETLYAFGSE